jgi:hypothetical protein
MFSGPPFRLNPYNWHPFLWLWQRRWIGYTAPDGQTEGHWEYRRWKAS